MKEYKRKYDQFLYMGQERWLAARRWGRTLLICLCLCVFGSFRQGGDSSEYKLKAVFIYNFTLFVEWDQSVKTEDFTIGVLGNSPIDGPLEEIARAKTCGGRKIVIHHYNSVDELTGSFCHILFIPRTANANVNTILSKVSKGTLTVSEKAGNADRGVAINFVIIDNKLRFESNPRAISSAGLKASSQLLKLAIIVD